MACFERSPPCMFSEKGTAEQVFNRMKECLYEKYGHLVKKSSVRLLKIRLFFPDAPLVK